MDEVTTGEVARRMEAMDRRIEARFAELSRRLEQLQFVTNDRYVAEQQAVMARLDGLEDKSKWFARTMAGALVTMVASALLMLFTARGGV